MTDSTLNNFGISGQSRERGRRIPSSSRSTNPRAALFFPARSGCAGVAQITGEFRGVRRAGEVSLRAAGACLSQPHKLASSLVQLQGSATNYPLNQGVTATVKSGSSETGITDCGESAPLSGQIVCRESRHCKLGSLFENPAINRLSGWSCGKTGYVAPNDSRQVSRPPFSEIPITEPRRAATFPAIGCWWSWRSVSSGVKAPKGLGTDGNEPLMKNRVGLCVPFRDRDSAGNILTPLSIYSTSSEAGKMDMPPLTRQRCHAKAGVSLAHSKREASEA